jgi:sec-independent protein translocase protein TatA
MKGAEKPWSGGYRSSAPAGTLSFQMEVHMPFGIGFGEMVLIFAVLLLVFGAKRLPEIGGAMGKSIRDFKRSINGLDEASVNQAIQDPAPPQHFQPTPQEPVATPQEVRADQGQA